MAPLVVGEGSLVQACGGEWSSASTPAELPTWFQSPAGVCCSLFFLLCLLYFFLSFSHSRFSDAFENPAIAETGCLLISFLSSLPSFFALFLLCGLFSPFLASSPKFYDLGVTGLSFYSHHHPMKVYFLSVCKLANRSVSSSPLFFFLLFPLVFTITGFKNLFLNIGNARLLKWVIIYVKSWTLEPEEN